MHPKLQSLQGTAKEPPPPMTKKVRFKYHPGRETQLPQPGAGENFSYSPPSAQCGRDEERQVVGGREGEEEGGAWRAGSLERSQPCTFSRKQ